MGRHVSVASLHNRIRSRRHVAGLSQQELAKRCGLTRQRVLGLDFLPLQDERYDLVIPLEFLNATPVQAMLDH